MSVFAFEEIMASPVVVTTIPFMSCLRRTGNRKQICFCCCTATYLGNNNNNAVASIQREIALASKHLPKVAATSFFDSHETIKFDKKKSFGSSMRCRKERICSGLLFFLLLHNALCNNNSARGHRRIIKRSPGQLGPIVSRIIARQPE